jgi:hypothetical protein
MTKLGQVCFCGNVAVAVDSGGTLLCGTHDDAARDLWAAMDLVTWDLTPAGEAALAAASRCPSCGAGAGEPPARSRCLWRWHRRAG